MQTDSVWSPEDTHAESIARFFNVSRETQEKLTIYVALLIKWQAQHQSGFFKDIATNLASSYP